MRERVARAGALLCVLCLLVAVGGAIAALPAAGRAQEPETDPAPVPQEAPAGSPSEPPEGTSAPPRGAHPPSGTLEEQPTPAGTPLPSGHPPAPSPPPSGAPEAGGLPPGHPPMPGQSSAAGAQGTGGALPLGHPTVPGGLPGQMSQAMRPPSLATAEESEDVPAGQIRVTVVDPGGAPIADAAVDVGSLARGERSRYNERTNAEGVATFTDLPTGSGQAYRVNVPHEGATYSTAPFQLSADHGYDVRVVRLPTTRDSRAVFFRAFRVIVEQRGERMHVIHQTELTNAGSETYVFPSEGKRAALPAEATAFQFQRVITDQRIEEVGGEHAIAMRGSLPPGTVQLAYAYDIPIGDEDLSIPVAIPFPYFGLQILAEAIPGLTMNVVGLSGERRLDQHGQPCESSQVDPTCAWVAVSQRSPEDALVERLTIQLRGIPGPSPVRWIVVVLAVLFVLGGVFFAFQKVDPRAGIEQARRRRRARLLAELRDLEDEFEAGEIGPEFRQNRRAAIVRDLAVLLYEEDVAREEGTHPTGRSSRASSPSGGSTRPASRAVR